MEVPADVINHISGCTRDMEIHIAYGIGGRLPFDAFVSLIERGKIPAPWRRSPKKKKRTTRASERL